jgi:hypothetical protein
MTSRLLSLVACASVVAASAGRAQSAETAACSVPASTRTVPGYFFGTLVMLDNAEVHDYIAQLLQTRGQAFQPMAPTELSTSVVADSAATGAAYASARFTVTDVGHVQDVALVTSSLSPAFDRSLLAALAAIDSGGLVPPFPDGMHGRRTFEVELEVGAITIAQLQHRDGAYGVIMPWAATAVPAWDNARPVRAAPRVETDKGTRVLWGGGSPVRFVVGRDGRIVPPTAEILPRNSDPRRTPEAARELLQPAVRITRYEPAMIGGCPIQAVSRSSVAVQRYHQE